MARDVVFKFRAEVGSTLIEFTAVLSILLTLTFAMIDFGRYVYANNVIQSAAQEGARAGVKTGGDINGAVMERILTLDPTKVSISSHSSSSDFHETIEVDVTYEFSFVTPIISAFASGPIEINGNASMLMFPES